MAKETVRELVNRVSFVIDQASLARVNTAFVQMGKRFSMLGNQMSRGMVSGLRSASTAVDGVTRSIQQQERAFSRHAVAQSSFMSRMSKMSQVSRRVMYDTLPLAAASGMGIVKSLQMYSMMQRTGITMDVLMGDKAASSQLQKDLIKFEAVTPFDIKNVFEYAQGLLLVGTNAADVVPMLEKLGDITAGDNEKVSRLLYQWQQVVSKNRADSQDIRIMGESLLPVRKILGEIWGTSGADTQKRIEAGEVTKEVMQQVIDIVALSRKGLMRDIGTKTIAGTFSTLVSSFQQMGAAIGKAADESFSLTSAFAKIAGYVNKVTQGFSNLPKFAKVMIMAVPALLIAVTAVAGLVAAAASLGIAFAMVKTSLLAVVGGIAVLGGGVLLAKAVALSLVLAAIWEEIFGYFTGTKNTLLEDWFGSWSKLKTDMESFFESLKAKLKESKLTSWMVNDSEAEPELTSKLGSAYSRASALRKQLGMGTGLESTGIFSKLVGASLGDKGALAYLADYLGTGINKMGPDGKMVPQSPEEMVAAWEAKDLRRSTDLRNPNALNTTVIVNVPGTDDKGNPTTKTYKAKATVVPGGMSTRTAHNSTQGVLLANF